MKEYWRKFASAIDERSTRERVLIWVTASVVVLVLFQALLVGPVGAARKRIVQETAERPGRDGHDGRAGADARSRQGDGPGCGRESKAGAARGKAGGICSGRSTCSRRNWFRRKKIRAVLDKILANNPRLQLIEMKTLPRVSISVEKEAATGEKGAPSRESKPASADETKSAEIYRHGVEVTMRGSYLDLLAYLQEIESLQVRMFWDKVNLSVTTYPTVTMRLVVYTISLDKAWLTV